MNKFSFIFSFIIVAIASLYTSALYAQYYYKDLLSTKKDNNEFSILKNNKINLVKISSFDERDQPSDGFFCEKTIKKNF
jgi:hypothetical protein